MLRRINAVDRLLLIDDDTELCEMLNDYLHSEGFQVEFVHDAAHGIEKALTGHHALVILDVMLPAMNGFDVLKRVRAESGIPVLMLTARGDEVDRIVGLEVGADDYLPKPFNPRELVARIRAILRRAEIAAAQIHGDECSEVLRVGDVEVDIGGRCVRVEGREVELTSVEFDLLTLLFRSVGKAVSREEISRSVLKRGLHPRERSVDVHISSLRRKLGHLQEDRERIRTIRGVGYLYTRPANPS
jgi:two-component system response regulator CpxR